ncbi:MAG: hypothetical protein D3922_06995 [Candidatus Electrothrix sp. AR1]|nr:hypothetical protein [Candidatus Electrothrix sp. AR1]
MAEKTTDKLELAAMIKALRSQLFEAQRDGQNEEIRFTIEDVELEVQVTTERQTKGDVSAKFYVLTSKVEGSKKDAVMQKLKLKLKASKADGKPLEVSDHGQRPD